MESTDDGKYRRGTRKLGLPFGQARPSQETDPIETIRLILALVSEESEKWATDSKLRVFALPPQTKDWSIELDRPCPLQEIR